MNKVFLFGNLVADPIVKQTSAGKNLVNFTIASHDNYQNNQHTNFFNCVAWNNQATYFANYVKKGDMVVIDGHLNRRNYVNKDGRNIYVTEIVVDSVKIARKKSQSANDNLVNVNDNFNTIGVNDDTNDTKQQITENVEENKDDKLNELDWINDDNQVKDTGDKK